MENTITIRGDRLYNEAEDIGFTIIADEDVADSYEFNQILVVRDPKGKLWAAHDCGCSCPTPFEDTLWPTDWIEVNNVSDVKGLFEEWGDYYGGIEAARFKIKQAIENALK